MQKINLKIVDSDLFSDEYHDIIINYMLKNEHGGISFKTGYIDSIYAGIKLSDMYNTLENENKVSVSPFHDSFRMLVINGWQDTLYQFCKIVFDEYTTDYLKNEFNVTTVDELFNFIVDTDYLFWDDDYKYDCIDWENGVFDISNYLEHTDEKTTNAIYNILDKNGWNEKELTPKQFDKIFSINDEYKCIVVY